MFIPQIMYIPYTSWVLQDLSKHLRIEMMTEVHAFLLAINHMGTYVHRLAQLASIYIFVNFGEQSQGAWFRERHDMIGLTKSLFQHAVVHCRSSIFQKQLVSKRPRTMYAIYYILIRILHLSLSYTETNKQRVLNKTHLVLDYIVE